MFEKINQGLMIFFMAIGTILMIMVMQSDATSSSSIGWFLALSYILLIVSTVAAFSGTIINLITNPKKLMRSGIGVGVMLVIVLVSYLMSSDEVLDVYKNVTPTGSKWSGAGLYTVYILLLGSVLAIIYSSVTRFIR